MKTYIDKLLLFLVLICSCNTNDKGNQDIWIGTYSIHDFDTENEIIRDGQRRLLIFESDSLRVKDFPRDIWSDVPLDFVYKYQLKDDMLLLNGKDRIDTINCKISEDSISITYYGDYPKKRIFEKLPSYHLEDEEVDFHQYLLSSSFEVFGSVRIEFRVDSTYVSPEFYFRLGRNQLWVTDKYDGELFLVTDGSSGFVLHINEINSEGFKGTVYGEENQEMIFRRLPNESKFDLANLMGEWIEFRPKNAPPPPPPPIFNDNIIFYEREELLFTDSTIQRKSFTSIDTITWETNRENDLILLLSSKSHLPARYKKWKIISLNEKELIIERIYKTGIGASYGKSFERIDRKVFERK